MDITIFPGRLSGNVKAIPSKSQAHRLLICSAFADKQTTLLCEHTNQDMEATVACLNALGATINRVPIGYVIKPVDQVPSTAVLPCGESGSTLRFMLPIAGALGVDATFMMSGRLSQRPLSPLWEEMERMGCHLSHPTYDSVRCTGRLYNGSYCIDGSVSSQFITGLLFAMSLLDGPSSLSITGKVESKPYIQMTLDVLRIFGVDIPDYTFSGVHRFRSPERIQVEGDWSNGAFFLAASTLGNPVNMSGLDLSSAQGDRIALSALESLQAHCTISGADIPDLIPILSVVAAANSGAVFTDIGRLRLKESDRVASVISMLESLGIHAEATEATLTVHPGTFHGGIVDAMNDHRIAMSAAIAATVADGPVTILGAQCVAKSYPSFWDVYRKLGGIYEQYLRT